jgi:hypothetical protein
MPDIIIRVIKIVNSVFLLFSYLIYQLYSRLQFWINIRNPGDVLKAYGILKIEGPNLTEILFLVPRIVKNYSQSTSTVIKYMKSYASRD